MLQSRKTAIILSGLLFSGLWLFFTQRVQNNQSVSHRKSVDLMMSLAEENLRKYFDTPLEVSESKVLPPFHFLLSLDYETLEPKFFATSSSVDFKLSALSIKTAYKSSGDQSKLFVYTSKTKDDMPFLVRVSLINDTLRLEGLPLRKIQNALDYAFSDQNWSLTDEKNHILISSDKTKERMRTKDLEANYISKPLLINGFKANLYVKKDSGFSVAVANAFGLLGIGLITFSLLGLGRSGDDALADLGFTEDFNDFEDSLPFDEDDEDEVQMVRLEHESEPAFKNSGLDGEQGSYSNEDTSLLSTTANVSTKTNGLDYSDFLMENPILGEKPTGKNSTVGFGEKSKVKIEGLKEDVSFVEEPEDSMTAQTELAAAPVQEKLEESLNSDSNKVSENEEDDEWLKLAEELTESLEEFAQNYDEPLSPVDQSAQTEIKG
jgi:hypothetical protein